MPERVGADVLCRVRRGGGVARVPVPYGGRAVDGVAGRGAVVVGSGGHWPLGDGAPGAARSGGCVMSAPMVPAWVRALAVMVPCPECGARGGELCLVDCTAEASLLA